MSKFVLGTIMLNLTINNTDVTVLSALTCTKTGKLISFSIAINQIQIITNKISGVPKMTEGF